MAAGMRDVAAAASVSVGTVSNVLNAPHKVAPATVARVHAAIDKLGFVRNDAARQLKAQRSRCVALLVLDIGNPFFTDVARGAERKKQSLNALGHLSKSSPLQSSVWSPDARSGNSCAHDGPRNAPMLCSALTICSLSGFCKL